jgi:hypothetical protein
MGKLETQLTLFLAVEQETKSSRHAIKVSMDRWLAAAGVNSQVGT